jgi:hypothetical protein
MGACASRYLSVNAGLKWRESMARLMGDKWHWSGPCHKLCVLLNDGEILPLYSAPEKSILINGLFDVQNS